MMISKPLSSEGSMIWLVCEVIYFSLGENMLTCDLR